MCIYIDISIKIYFTIYFINNIIVLMEYIYIKYLVKEFYL